MSNFDTFKSNTLLIVAIVAISLKEVITSRKAEVLVNESTFITCFSTKVKKIQWHHTPPGKSNKYVYAGGNFYPPYNTGRFQVDNHLTSNMYTLVITNVMLEDAGLYECKDDVESGVFDSTHLTVLDSSPVCSSNMNPNGFVGPNTCNIEQENMTFSCAVSFSGNSPNLMWSTLNGSQALNSSICESKDNRINCSLSVKADPSFDGSTFTCQTTTSNDARYNCSIEDIRVKYFFGDYEVAEKRVGDNVTCVVASNLQIHYNWTIQQNNEDNIFGANQTIYFQKPGSYKCSVKYSIQDVTCYAALLYVNVASIVDDKETVANSYDIIALVSVSIGGSVGVMCLVAVIIFAVYRKKCIKDSELKCMKCSDQAANARELPCKHVICLDCIQVLVRDNARQHGIKCPTCKVPFTVTVVPQDRRQQEQNKYVKDEYSVEIKEDRSPFCLKSKVMGMAIMDNSVFVVCQKPPNVIFKFDIGASDIAVPVELNISEMAWPRGMAASEKHSCLYITDWNHMFTGQLWRYKYKRGEETRVDRPVAVLDVQPFGVSVSPKNDEVLVTCATPVDVSHKRGWIYVYRPSGDEFQKVRTIDLPDLEIPRHAILTASSQFVVCHGWSLVPRHGVTSFEDGENGVLIAKRFYGRNSGGGGADENDVNRPLSLTTDIGGMLLVVDYNNSRIQLLTEDFQLVRHLLTKGEHGIESPRHVCQDPSTGRLYVGQEDGKVRIFI